MMAKNNVEANNNFLPNNLNVLLKYIATSTSHPPPPPPPKKRSWGTKWKTAESGIQGYPNDTQI